MTSPILVLFQPVFYWALLQLQANVNLTVIRIHPPLIYKNLKFQQAKLATGRRILTYLPKLQWKCSWECSRSVGSVFVIIGWLCGSLQSRIFKWFITQVAWKLQYASRLYGLLNLFNTIYKWRALLENLPPAGGPHGGESVKQYSQLFPVPVAEFICLIWTYSTLFPCLLWQLCHNMWHWQQMGFISHL